MLTGPEHVCLPGKTGSDRRAVKAALFDPEQKSQRARTPDTDTRTRRQEFESLRVRLPARFNIPAIARELLVQDRLAFLFRTLLVIFAAQLVRFRSGGSP
jgi:hypothetical protein